MWPHDRTEGNYVPFPEGWRTVQECPIYWKIMTICFRAFSFLIIISWWTFTGKLISSTSPFLIHTLKYKLSCCEMLEKDDFKVSPCGMRTQTWGSSWAVKPESGSALKAEGLEQVATFQNLTFYVKKRSLLNRTQSPSKVTIYNATTYMKS